MITQTIRISTFTIAMTFGLLPGPALTIAAAQEEDTFPQVVSGTLVKLDLRTLQGLLRTDLGKLVFFDVPKVYLFENITVGARIIVQLDPNGQAVKVMDASLPDFIIGPVAMPAVNAEP